jgi:hypothetical protein
MLLLLAPGCQTTPRSAQDEIVLNPVTHVVVCWLKNPGDARARQRIIESVQRLRTIPGVLDLQAGGVVPSDRPVVDSTYDLALVVTFANERALRAYDQHPVHQQLVREVIQPLVGRFIVYDFRNQ